VLSVEEEAIVIAFRRHIANAAVIGANQVAQVFEFEARDSAVEPTRSQNITVSCLRSDSAEVVGTAWAIP
jgi:hypothetical protein